MISSKSLDGRKDSQPVKSILHSELKDQVLPSLERVGIKTGIQLTTLTNIYNKI